MSESSAAELSIAVGEMEEAFQRIIDNGYFDHERLRKSQELWEAFAEAEGQLHAGIVHGGSMASMVYFMQKTHVTNERTLELNRKAKFGEGDV